MTIVSLSARYESATVGEFIEHHSTDVSSTGIFIKTASAIPIGTLIEFEVQIAGRRTIIAGVGRVVWTRDPAHASAERPTGIGIRYIELDESSKALIGKVVAARPDAGSRYEEEAKNSAGLTPAPPTTAGPPKVRPSLRPSPSPSRVPPRPGPPRGARRALPPVTPPPRRTTSPPEPPPPPAPTSSPEASVEAEAEEDMTLYEPMPPMRKGRKATLVGLGAPLPPVTHPPRRPVSLPAPARPPRPSAPEAASALSAEESAEEATGTEPDAMTIMGTTPAPPLPEATLVEIAPEVVPLSLTAVAQPTPSAVAGGGRPHPGPARGRAKVIVMAGAALIATVGLVLLATRPRAAPSGSRPTPPAIPSALAAPPEPAIPAPIATTAQSNDDAQGAGAEDAAPPPAATTAPNVAVASPPPERKVPWMGGPPEATAAPSPGPAASVAQDLAAPRNEAPRPSSTHAQAAEIPAPIAKPKATPSASAAREAATPTATAAPPAPKPSTNCTPPYSLDADGNKHFKAECFVH